MSAKKAGMAVVKKKRLKPRTGKVRSRAAQLIVAPPEEISFNFRQLRFIEEYLIDCNATQAAIRAGYSARSGASIASELLSLPKIANEVERRRRILDEECGLSARRIRLEIARLAFSNVNDYTLDTVRGRLDTAEGIDPGAIGAVASVKFEKKVIGKGNGADDGEVEIAEISAEYKLWSKPDALKMGMQLLGMVKDDNAAINLGVQIVLDGGRTGVERLTALPEVLTT